MKDASEFEVVLRENGPAIYTLAVRLCGNLADGQDLAQETFVKAYEKWEQFRGEADVKTWLHRICINLWKNRVRYEKRRKFWKHFSFNFNRDGEESELEIPSPEPPVERPMEKADEQTQLEISLQRLDPQERAVILLYDVEDKSYAEIGDLLRIPVGTVRSRLSRARERLRELFNEVRESGVNG